MAHSIYLYKHIFICSVKLCLLNCAEHFYIGQLTYFSRHIFSLCSFILDRMTFCWHMLQLISFMVQSEDSCSSWSTRNTKSSHNGQFSSIWVQCFKWMSLSVSRIVFFLQRGQITFLFKQIRVWFLIKSSYFMSSFCFSLQHSRPHLTSFSFRKTILRMVVGLKP